MLSDETHTVLRCRPAELGSWQDTGRRPVAYSTVGLRGGGQAMLKTMFICVDYWPAGDWPVMLFETVLVDLRTARIFDEFTARYATFDEARHGHSKALERVRRVEASE